MKINMLLKTEERNWCKLPAVFRIT